jgi:molybdopterin molybdotransferase
LDTVVAHEMVQVQGDRITVPLGRVHTGDNRRLRGEDIAQGQAALRQGQRLTPAAWGLLASLGLPEVAVRQRLRVAYFSTGDEILSLGQVPREGAVYDSNRYTVCGLLQRMGCEWIDLGVVPDDPHRLRAAFEEAAQRADAIITSGGVSVGEADHTKALMRELGDVDFWRIAMRPGRPMAVGRMGQTLMFGLPGNPVAVMVTFLAFVRPALWRMMGCTDAPPLLVRAQSQQAMRKKAGRTEYQRGVVSRSDNGTLQVSTTGNQGSGVLSSMVQGNALIVLHHDQGHVAEGDPVDVMLFDGAI